MLFILFTVILHILIVCRVCVHYGSSQFYVRNSPEVGFVILSPEYLAIDRIQKTSDGKIVCRMDLQRVNV